MGHGIIFHSGARKGFEICPNPSAGLITVKAVPRMTARPNGLVFSVRSPVAGSGTLRAKYGLSVVEERGLVTTHL